VSRKRPTLAQRVAELERLVAELDTRTSGLRRIGPMPREPDADPAELQRIIEEGLARREATGG
jgi:hypothetical protein